LTVKAGVRKGVADHRPATVVLGLPGTLHDKSKVALAAIDRSCAAWVRPREILPNREDEILAMLALLSRLQHGIHAALPGAKAFVRPGFDEGV